MVTSTAALLTAWEAGAAEDPFYRSASLLRSLDQVPADSSLERMTVGQCDARLFHLRRLLFGEQLDLVATCPACGGDVELSLAVIELQPASTSNPVSSVEVMKDGFRLSCRVPVNADLSALAALGDRATPGDLLERCLLEASSPDSDDVAVSELPEPLVEAALEAIAENDPGAQTTLEISCPCGSDWIEELDIRSVVWTELTDWVGRTLTEIHQLAHSYGWSEADTLAVPAWRRRWYLEASGW